MKVQFKLQLQGPTAVMVDWAKELLKTAKKIGYRVITKPVKYLLERVYQKR